MSDLLKQYLTDSHQRRSEHQLAVDSFMRQAAQPLPLRPLCPAEDIRVLRAKLIYEEALETLNGLGVAVVVQTEDGDKVQLNQPLLGTARDVLFVTRDFDEPEALAYPFDLTAVVDGCCDVRVVTTGTLSACGVPDYLHQYLVDASNLAKFGAGGYRRSDGKWIKPADWRKPPLDQVLLAQGADPKLIYTEQEKSV